MKKYVYIVVILLVLAGAAWVADSYRSRSLDGVACTMDARICPDGSAVGRIPPRCEFAACPGSGTSEANIRVFSPVAGDRVGRPVVIVGLAREFENTFNYELLDAENHVIAAAYGTAQAPDVGRYGAFSVALNYTSMPSTKTGFVKVFAHSAKDGSEIDVVKIPVTFADEEMTPLKVYFDLPAMKQSTDPSLVVEQCEGVYPVMRVVPKTTAVAQAAIKELLKGPTPAEFSAGYTTSINSGVVLRSLSISGGVATVDFSEDFLHEFGGSCRVGMVIDQLSSTLAQFSTIKEALFLVEGQPDRIQP